MLGVVKELLGSDSHVTVPLPSFRIYLYCSTVFAGTFTVTIQMINGLSLQIQMKDKKLTAPNRIIGRRENKCSIRGPILQGAHAPSNVNVLCHNINSAKQNAHGETKQDSPPKTVVASTVNVTATVAPAPLPEVEQVLGAVNPLAPQPALTTPALA